MSGPHELSGPGMVGNLACPGCKTPRRQFEAPPFRSVYCSESCHDRHRARFDRKLDAAGRLAARRERKRRAAGDDQ